MGMVADIFEELWNTELKYKGVRVNIFGIPRFKDYSRNSMQVTLSRLHKNGYVESKNRQWFLTEKGKTRLNRNKLKQLDLIPIINSPKNLLVMFDIPEQKKKEREWFRKHLRKLDYIMIQKSVWVGPSPLPKEFIDYIKSIKLRDTIKTFKLEKGYTIK